MKETIGIHFQLLGLRDRNLNHKSMCLLRVDHQYGRKIGILKSSEVKKVLCLKTNLSLLLVRESKQ